MTSNFDKNEFVTKQMMFDVFYMMYILVALISVICLRLYLHFNDKPEKPIVANVNGIEIPDVDVFRVFGNIPTPKEMANM